MIYYAINHYVTEGDNPMESIVHGDDSLAVWDDSDPQTNPPDHTHDQPSNGWHWKTNPSGWQEHPDALKQYVSDATGIERVSPWDTTLTDGIER